MKTLEEIEKKIGVCKAAIRNYESAIDFRKKEAQNLEKEKQEILNKKILNLDSISKKFYFIIEGFKYNLLRTDSRGFKLFCLNNFNRALEKCIEDKINIEDFINILKNAGDNIGFGVMTFGIGENHHTIYYDGHRPISEFYKHV